MQPNAPVECHVDRRERGAPVGEGKPPRVAVGEHVDHGLLATGPSLCALGVADLLEQRRASLADAVAEVRVLVCEPARLRLRGGDRGGGTAPALQGRPDRCLHAGGAHRQVHGRRPRGPQPHAGRRHRLEHELVGRGGRPGGKVDAVRGGAADQARAAHVHVLDGGGHLLHRGDVLHDEVVGKKPLVDDLHRGLTLEPNRAVPFAVHPHGAPCTRGALKIVAWA
mmetsp:Transcript_85749/g.227379  ORF Transcript_85749/g.227379 Transcript_85749/m.227379 type:complete len:224 (-) Transcript_85749:2-673(-)